MADWEDAPAAQWEDAPAETPGLGTQLLNVGKDVAGAVAGGAGHLVETGERLGTALAGGSPEPYGYAGGPIERYTRPFQHAPDIEHPDEKEKIRRAAPKVQDTAPVRAALETPAGQTLTEAGSAALTDVGSLLGAAALPEQVAAGAARLAPAAETSTIRGFGRPEPTAPAGPRGFTRDEFAPKPPTAAPAGQPTTAPAQTPPPPAARAPTAPEAPSAGPDHAGRPAPDVHDPAFFPAPDNQGLKSGTVSPQEQAARQAAVERGAPTLPKVRDSAITNNYADQGRDWTGVQAKDPHALAQVSAEGTALHQEAGRISSETGGQIGTGESADTVRGKAYQDWHDTTVNALNKHIDATYAAEDTAAKQIATPGSNLKGVLANDALIDSANAGHVRNSVISLGRNMGVDLTDPNATMNAWQVEQLRKHAGKVYGNAPSIAQAIKDAADADLPPGAYVRARALTKLKKGLFDNRDGINQLGASKDIDPDTGRPRPENRPVKAPDVMKKIESMDPDQVRHIVGTMKNSSTILDRLGDPEAAASVTDKAFRAAQQLQSHLSERWIDEAGKGGGWNTKRAHQYLRNNQETLSAVMSPEQMHQIRNVSNAANVLDLDKGYKGAFAQFSTGASWLRQRLGRTVEGAITDAIPLGNTIGEMTGISEWARRKLGGPEKGNPPKNFTRPLGQRIPGQGGWIGNKPEMHDFANAEHVEMATPFTHSIDEESGDHFFATGDGAAHLIAEPTPNGLRVRASQSNEPGQGHGGVLYKNAADYALTNGGKFESDAMVSKAAARRWAELGQQGYKLKKDPRATKTDSGGWMNQGDRPVFTITGRRQPPALAPNAAAAAERIRAREGELGVAGASRPLGEVIGGGNQRGAFGSPRQPRDPMTGRLLTKEEIAKRNQQTPTSNQLMGVMGGGETRPLGARIGGGRQRGAIGNLSPKGEAPLAGAPEGDRPNGAARASAAAYRKQTGYGAPLQDYRYVDPAVGKNVADAYDAMKHDPTNPKVRAAYDAFKAETLAQYKHLTKGGVKSEFIGADQANPYPNLHMVHDDIRNNKHLWVYPTSQGFGGSMLNIGLKVGENGSITADQALAALKKRGITASEHAVHESATEPTLVAKTNRALSPKEAHDLAAELHQQSIAQYTPGQGGELYGPGAAQWRPFQSKYFMDLKGQTDTTANMEHPLLEKAPVKIGGQDATYNDLFRIVHDYYGHSENGNGFGPNGEYNAWRSHRTMYSDAARPAMDSETLGQNAWVNYGPHGERNRGLITERGTGQNEITYADQKAGLLPPKVVQGAEQGVSKAEHHVTNLLTPQERLQLRSDTTKRLMDAFNNAPAEEEYAAAALAGKAKRGWYRNSAEAISNVFGVDGPRFAGLLSSMSPQVSVQTNFHNALRTFINWDKAGRPVEPAAIRQIMEDSSHRGEATALSGKSNVLDAWFHNGVRALTAEDPMNIKLSGPKVHSFYSNLIDHVNEVMNDAWMAAFAKIDPAAKGTKLSGALNKTGPGKSATYLALSAKVRGAARMLSHLTGETWTPREVQETVWSWAKAAYEHAEELGDRSIPELVKNGDITDDLIKSTPDFHQLFGSAEHRGFLQSSRFARNAERVAGWQSPSANAAGTSEASAATEKALRPHLLSAANRLEKLRQERNATVGEEAPF